MANIVFEKDRNYDRTVSSLDRGRRSMYFQTWCYQHKHEVALAGQGMGLSRQQ
jgi:hypothetical protein